MGDAPRLLGNEPRWQGAVVDWVAPEPDIRLRYAEWTAFGAPRGSVHIFNGRTEYIEKYADVIGRFVDMGFNVTCHDWRGQGASTRAEGVSTRGHIVDFAEYQRDAQAIMARAAHLQGPHYLFCHSMGGAIGTRYLHGEHQIAAAIYSAPMWKIHLPKVLDLLAPHILTFYQWRDALDRVALGTRDATYESYASFRNNFLTTDPEQYQRLVDFARAYPELGVGGPTYQWMLAARKENIALDALPLPAVRALVFVGSLEAVVSRRKILARLRDRPDYRLVHFQGAKHEVYLERPPILTSMWRDIADFIGN